MRYRWSREKGGIVGPTPSFTFTPYHPPSSTPSLKSASENIQLRSVGKSQSVNDHWYQVTLSQSVSRYVNKSINKLFLLSLLCQLSIIPWIVIIFQLVTSVNVTPMEHSLHVKPTNAHQITYKLLIQANVTKEVRYVVEWCAVEKDQCVCQTVNHVWKDIP